MPLESNAAVTVSSASAPRARLCLSHVSVRHARTFCIKCVSVGQRSLRHMQSAHAPGGFSPRARISTSNTPAQMKVRGVTLKQGERTQIEGHASPKEPHAFSIGSLSGTTQVTWVARMWVCEVCVSVCVVLSVGQGGVLKFWQSVPLYTGGKISSEFFSIGYNTARVPDPRRYYKDPDNEKDLQKSLSTWRSSGSVLHTYLHLSTCFCMHCSCLSPMCIGIYDFFTAFDICTNWGPEPELKKVIDQKEQTRHIKDG